MKELVVLENDQAVTTSLQIAENFEKRHADVIRAIEDKIHSTQNSVQYKKMFKKDVYRDASGKQNKMFYLNRDGFTFIAMGFTGVKADEFKLKYIEAFNQMEQQLQKQLPGTYKEALLQLVEQVEQNEMLEQRIAEYEPKISYLDTILSSKDTVTITQIAADYGMSAQAMNKLLNELNVQHKVGGQWILYRRHMRHGYTKSHTTEIPKADGTSMVVMNTKWTQKGRLFLYELLKDEDIYPQMDLELEEA